MNGGKEPEKSMLAAQHNDNDDDDDDDTYISFVLTYYAAF